MRTNARIYFNNHNMEFLLTNAFMQLIRALRVKRADEEIDKDDIEVATLLQKKGKGKINMGHMFVLFNLDYLMCQFDICSSLV